MALAPRWHTAAFVFVTVAVAITGTLLEPRGAALPVAEARGSRVTAVYLPLLSVQWGLLFYVCRVGRARNALPELLGKRWSNVGRAATDGLLALLAGVTIVLLEWVGRRLFPMGRNAALVSLLPSTEAERLTWAVVAVSVGFCEEVVYRGYLRTQLVAFTGRRTVGVVLQALLFGIAHAEQGPGAALRVALYGLLLGVLAEVRQSLLPGILCHIGIDLLSGLVHR